MSIHKLGTRAKPQWSIRWRNKGDTTQHRLTLPAGISKAEADQVEAKIKLEVRLTGRYDRVEAPPIDLAAAIDEYIAARGTATRRGAAAKPATLRLYDNVLRRRMLPFVKGRGGAASLHGLERSTVARFLDALATEGLKPSAIHTYGATVHAFWRWAHERWPEHVHVPVVDAPPPNPGNIYSPTLDEVDRMLAAMAKPVRGRNAFPRAVYRACIIMRYTGLRKFQAAGLRWGDLIVDFDGQGPALHIGKDNCKTAAEAALDRRIPITSGLHGTLQAWRKSDGNPEDNVTVVGPGFPREPEEAVNGAWRRSEVEEYKWLGQPTRAMRRALNTYLQGQGIPDPCVDWYIGHAPIRLNARYYTSQTLAWWRLLLPVLQEMPDYRGPE
ncbi:MAG: hypothetical protein KKI08_02800 [Armatimonadetes bacterium]|nr:hypothetical protein [Armatimonadota bacterium]